MSNRKNYLLIICSLFVLLACNTNKSETNIELDNGDKWLVNAEMKPHLEKQHDLLQDYSSTKNDDYLALANQLKEANNDLIKSCTMEGKSHDELHKWLYPHIQLIDSLSKSPSIGLA